MTILDNGTAFGFLSHKYRRLRRWQEKLLKKKKQKEIDNYLYTTTVMSLFRFIGTLSRDFLLQF